MSPVIRLSNELYERLSKYANGFDTPSSVIERLINSYEENKRSMVKNQPDYVYNEQKTEEHSISPKKFSRFNKKPRDKAKERSLKLAIGNSLNWGTFRKIGDSLLQFENSNKKVLCKYSSFSTDHSRWFWGVANKYWTNWDNNFYLALIMENDNLKEFSYLLLNPSESKTLFSRDEISESNGEKKINLRLYKSDNKFHLQEWFEFDVEGKIKPLKLEN